MENDFQRLLRAILAEHFPGKGGQKRLAAAIDIDASRMSRAVRTGDYSFNLENCLRLAKAGKRSPIEVLEAAHKYEEATLLKRAGFGTSDLLPGEADLIALWRQLWPEDHEEFERRMTYVAGLRAEMSPKPGDRPHSVAPLHAMPGKAGRRTRR